MYRTLAVLVLICLVTSIAGPVCAESLWQDPKSAQTYSDKRACKVGDVVTIVINESASSTQTAATSAKKSSQTSTGPGIGPLLSKIPAFKWGGSDSLDGSGSTSRTTTFTAQMTAVVTKVNNNGTLEIEGSRYVQTNREKEELKLSGTIRAEDIALDNTVQSSVIANAKITHSGTGPIGSRQREGIIQRILKILF